MKESVIVFGTGRVFKRLIDKVIGDYNVIFCVDNNQELWGNSINGIKILSPDAIKGRTENILVTTGFLYYDEILSQINGMGIGSERIFWIQKRERENPYEIVPSEIDRWLDDEKGLVDYDLFNNGKDDGNGVLLLCSFHSVYPINLIRNIKKRFDNSISLLTNSDDYKEELVGLADHIYCYETVVDLYNILRKIPVYKTIHALWIEALWGFFYKEIEKKSRNLCLFIGGSDLYRASKRELEIKKRIIEVSDYIAVEMETVREDFLKVFPGNDKKMYFLRYGLEYIECCDSLPSKENIKNYFGIDSDKVVVTCGHNAISAHQHKKIISELNALEPEIRDRAIFVFPMTYGDTSGEYTEEIRKLLDDSLFEYRLFSDFMEYYELAEYITISDIMIHVQTTDALSTTMLEHMYSGSVVIAGSWLPYQSLRDRGIEFLSVDSIDDLDVVLKDVINRLDEYKNKCQKNKNIIEEMSGWNSMAKKWVDLWND